MVSKKVALILVVVIMLCSVFLETVSAGGKGGQTIILGGAGGCGGLLYRTKGKDGKKGEMIIMQPCDKHDDDHDVTYDSQGFIPYPMFMGGYGHGYGRKRK